MKKLIFLSLIFTASLSAREEIPKEFMQKHKARIIEIAETAKRKFPNEYGYQMGWINVEVRDLYELCKTREALGLPIEGI